MQGSSPVGMVMVYSKEGDLLFKEKSGLYGPYGVRVVSEAGYVTVRAGSTLRAGATGFVTVYAAEDVCVNRSLVQGELINVVTEASLLEFKENLVQVPPQGGLVHLVALGSTVDITGTTFRNVHSGDLVIQAGTIVP